MSLDNSSRNVANFRPSGKISLWFREISLCNPGNIPRRVHCCKLRPGFFYCMVTRSALRKCGEKIVYFGKNISYLMTTSMLSNALIRSELPNAFRMCASYSELTSNFVTMNATRFCGIRWLIRIQCARVK